MDHKEPRQNGRKTISLHTLSAVLAAIFILVMLSGSYLRFVWNRYQNMAENQALQLGWSIEAMLHIEHILELVSDSSAPVSTEAIFVEHSLTHLVESTDAIYYAYILKQQDGRTLVVADSSGAQSSTSKPTKRSCEQTVEINNLPFATGQCLLTEPVSTPCGDYIRTLIPIRHPESGQTIAVLGLSYSAAEWQANVKQRMIPDIVIVICLLALIVSLISLGHKQGRLRQTSEKLAFQETLYRNIFEQAPIGIFLQEGRRRLKQGPDKGYICINPMGAAILGRNVAELEDMSLSELFFKDDFASTMHQYERFQKGEISSYEIEGRLVRPDDSIVWANVKIIDFFAGPSFETLFLVLFEDITERKQSEKSLRESERSKSVFFSHLPGMAYRCKNNATWTMEFVSEGCYALTGYKPESLLQDSQISYSEIISPEYLDAVRSTWERVLLNRQRYQDEYEIITKSGERKWVLEVGQGIYDQNGDVEALEGIVLDITELKQNEYKVAYLRDHDFLTGLYNRIYIEQEKKRLDQPEFWPLSVTICDIDGLRMINDAYGHEEGDRLIKTVARLIQGCLPRSCVLGYMGSGEFCVLMPNTDSEQAHRLKTSINNAVSSYNRTNEKALYTISVTIGHSTKQTADQQIQDVTKAAMDYLSSRKLVNQNSSHSAIVSSIMATLYAKSQETEEHGQRMGEWCQMLGERLGLEQKDLDDLNLLSKLHDIGKIGIDDSILNKPGPLDEDEWREMRKHPEIGHRIATSTPQLDHIAHYILCHHERWDGKGYPLGLKGEEIPIVDRILAVVDAFDAMTEDRVYRKALPIDVAIEGIRENAGTQFDPNIVDIFLELIEARENPVHPKKDAPELQQNMAH